MSDCDSVPVEVNGGEGEQCEYWSCQNEASTLVRFEKTKPEQHIWFCAPHAGNSVQKHNDAEVIDGGE